MKIDTENLHILPYILNPLHLPFVFKNSRITNLLFGIQLHYLISLSDDRLISYDTDQQCDRQTHADGQTRSARNASHA